jgi:hypothetical protein
MATACKPDFQVVGTPEQERIGWMVSGTVFYGYTHTYTALQRRTPCGRTSARASKSTASNFGTQPYHSYSTVNGQVVSLSSDQQMTAREGQQPAMPLPGVDRQPLASQLQYHSSRNRQSTPQTSPSRHAQYWLLRGQVPCSSTLGMSLRLQVPS